MAKGTDIIKGCNYRMVAYPESVAPDFIDRLKGMGVQHFAVSMLHDKDVYSYDEFNEDGELVHRAGDIKKPHYHIFIKFSGSVTWKTVYDRIAKPLGFVLDHKADKCLVFCEATGLRYFLHLDDPDKFQYPIEYLDQCFFFGYDIKKLEEIFLATNYRVSMILDCKKIVCAYDICYFNKLMDYLELVQAFDLLEFITFTGRNAIKEYIKDRCLENYGDYKVSPSKREQFCATHNITPIEQVLDDLRSKDASYRVD